MRSYSCDKARNAIALGEPTALHMYFEYASHGSLSGLVKRFLRQDRLTPEVFVWLVIRNLVRACMLVEILNLVHPDIKIDNIFLDDDRGPTGFLAYCNAVISDFNIMCGLNERINYSMGTLGFRTLAWALWTRNLTGTSLPGDPDDN
ncbi:hypothetical protein EJ02DRAFT_196661 [Clathrospora elynae]|uniref:Protein kinase domain-containing protein n=1 Tax=Clathrospora elynae TaxID=706981 RepID=A0A6A5T2E4_9PLEO|nr:hypothetical protein EJ02DRAFT_196661 [Clathrospora elynae]